MKNFFFTLINSASVALDCWHNWHILDWRGFSVSLICSKCKSCYSSARSLAMVFAPSLIVVNNDRNSRSEFLPHLADRCHWKWFISDKTLLFKNIDYIKFFFDVFLPGVFTLIEHQILVDDLIQIIIIRLWRPRIARAKRPGARCCLLRLLMSLCLFCPILLVALFYHFWNYVQ